MSKTILVVDDEQDILDLLRFNLESEGYQVYTAAEGETALKSARRYRPDLIILDVMLPGKDGWEVIRELRRDSVTQHLPVIFLTAKDSEIDEVVGLELGADDYIVKPISMRKLLARVKLALRKSSTSNDQPAQKIDFGDVIIDPDSYSVIVQGQPVTFTKKEFEILLFLAQRPGRVVKREFLLDHVWGEDVVVIDRTIDVHIRKIREKLGEKYMHHIETIKGVGYRFIAEMRND
ncbi:response regulator transcription factor [candidate division KSB1 bacterium]|nr:response regulator transcription factor [candidate division KSB1 bacterium]